VRPGERAEGVVASALVSANSLAAAGASKAGYLIKRSAQGLVHSWKKRWVVVHESLLYYFASPEAAVPLGVVLLPGATVVLKTQAKLRHAPTCITVTTRADRVFYFATSLAPGREGDVTGGGGGDADLISWLDVMTAVPGVLAIQAAPGAGAGAGASAGAGAGGGSAEAAGEPPTLPRASSQQWHDLAAKMAADADAPAAPEAAAPESAPARARLPPGLASARTMVSGSDLEASLCALGVDAGDAARAGAALSAAEPALRARVAAALRGAAAQAADLELRLEDARAAQSSLETEREALAAQAEAGAAAAAAADARARASEAAAAAGAAAAARARDEAGAAAAALADAAAAGAAAAGRAAAAEGEAAALRAQAGALERERAALLGRAEAAEAAAARGSGDGQAARDAAAALAADNAALRADAAAARAAALDAAAGASDAARREVERLSADASSLRADLAAARAAAAAAADDAAAADKEADDLAAANAELTERVQALVAENAGVRGELEEFYSTCDAQKAMIAALRAKADAAAAR
jgi:hypothetical protein